MLIKHWKEIDVDFFDEVQWLAWNLLNFKTKKVLRERYPEWWECTFFGLISPTDDWLKFYEYGVIVLEDKVHWMARHIVLSKSLLKYDFSKNFPLILENQLE